MPRAVIPPEGSLSPVGEVKTGTVREAALQAPG